MTCPNCRNIISKDSDYCIFCGHVLTRKGKAAVRYEADAKKVRRTAAGKAQRFFLIVALLFGAAVFGAVLLSPEIPWYASRVTQAPQPVETPAPTPVITPEPTPTVSPEPSPTATPEPTVTATPEPSATVSPEPAFTATPEPSATVSPATEAVSPTPETSEDPDATPSPDTDGAFYGRSGAYPVVMYLSVAESDDPDTQAAVNALMDERFEGTITLNIDANGDGFVTIEQEFFSQEPVSVSAFVDSEGTISTDTLYGMLYGNGYRMTVICVCSDDSISGFFWVDNELTHIEFLYYG